MGATRSNMPSMKVMVSVAILLAISLHTTDGQCQLPAALAVDGVAGSGLYTTLSDVSQTCTEACLVCEQAVGANTAAAPTGLATAAAMTSLANSICPTIGYTFTINGDGNPATIGIAGLAAGADPATVAGLRAAATTVTGAITSSGRFTANVASVAAGVNTLVSAGQVCQCLTTNANTCQVCGCAFLGLPTAAPTSSPTTAPTVHTVSPTEGSYWNVPADDSLSAGDIAGIVIGAVGGAFLFLLVGTLIGGMVGGKSGGTAAAPAGQL